METSKHTILKEKMVSMVNVKYVEMIIMFDKGELTKLSILDFKKQNGDMCIDIASASKEDEGELFPLLEWFSNTPGWWSEPYYSWKKTRWPSK